MAIEIYMPALSPTMEEGTLATWMIKEGDTVSSGDVIAEIETDKATMEVEAIDEGTVAKILVDAGTENVKVGTLIAVLAEEGADAAGISAAPADTETPVPQAVPGSEPVPVSEPNKVLDPVPAAAGSVSHDGGRIKASPLARRIAAQKGLDLSAITGSGPHGRIIKKDVERAESAPVTDVAAATTDVAPAAVSSAMAAAPAPASYAPPHADTPFEERKLSGMRKTIARRLTESKTTVPHFYLTIETELTKLMAQRKDLNARLSDSGVKLSVNDFIIKAVAMALKKVPAANVQFAGDKMYWYDRADISVAVALDGGLVTPVIRGAEGLGLSDISNSMKELATKARDGKLMPEDYAGGTFSISNLGMMGIKEFSAVINPPQGAILAIGAGEMRPVVKDGEVTAALMMSCTMACDHRAIDGAVGAEFLAAFKGFIEDPMMMLV